MSDKEVVDTAFVKLEDIEGMSERIKDDQFSACVFNALKLHGKKGVDKYEFYVARNHPDAHVVFWMHKNDQTCMGLHCARNELDLVKGLLKETTLIDFKKTLCFFHLDDGLLDVVQGLARDLTGKELTTGKCQAFCYRPEEEAALKCPAGFEVRHLNESGVRQMYSQWRYKDCSLGVETFLGISEAGLSAGAFEGDRQEHQVILEDIDKAPEDRLPVSHATLTNYGLIGLLRTKEEFRRRGLGALVMGACARMLIAQGFVPMVAFEDSEPEGLMMVEKMKDWEKAYQLTWAWQ